MSQPRRKKATLHQFGIMLDFFENHPEMIQGKLADGFTVERREKLWLELTMLLNSDTLGAQKTPQKWRKTWVDIKSEAKLKDRETKEQSRLRGELSPPPLPLHLARIMTLIRLSNALNNQAGKEIKSADQPCIIKECFTEEEASPETEMLYIGNIELNGDTSPTIKIENLSDNSTSDIACFAKMDDMPSTSVESPFQKVPDILTSGEMPSESTLDISTSVESLCTNISEIPRESKSVPTEKNSEIRSTCTKAGSQTVFDPFISTSELPREKNCNNLPKSSCEKVCDILTTSVQKLSDVIKNSENRTITAFNALTKATAKANELREKQLQIEEERNRLYQERNEILFTLVNTFLEKKANHQH